jgi:hypothetical protein
LKAAKAGTRAIGRPDRIGFAHFVCRLLRELDLDITAPADVKRPPSRDRSHGNDSCHASNGTPSATRSELTDAMKFHLMIGKNATALCAGGSHCSRYGTTIWRPAIRDAWADHGDSSVPKRDAAGFEPWAVGATARRLAQRWIADFLEKHQY